MAKQTLYPDVQTAAYHISRIVNDYLQKEGLAWIIGKLKTNIIKTVYRRKPSTAYKRENSFQNSIRGRLTEIGKSSSSYRFEIMAFPDPESMNPHHTSWASGEEDWNGINVDKNLSDWLNNGHGGMGVHYKPTNFIQKTEAEITNPTGLIAGLHAKLRASGFKITKGD